MTKEEQYIEMRKKVLFEKFGESYYIKKRLELYKDNPTLENIFCNDKISCEKCMECGETCCQNYPCAFSPDDFIDITDLDYMRSILDVGIICISEEYPTINYIRPRKVADEGRIVRYRHYLSFSQCVLLGENGCMLDANYRPCEGLTLYSNFNNEKSCHQFYNSEDKFDDWKKYREITDELAAEYYDKIYEKEEITKEDVLLLQKRIAGYNK